MKIKVDYSLYLVTDRELMSTNTLEEAVEQAILGGCTLVQLREKECSSLEFYQTALKVKDITNKYNIPLIINDRIDIALATNAAGVHIGQSDIPTKVARKIIGNDKILGVSASNLDEAISAQADGADYLGIGAMFATETKTNAVLVSIDDIKVIRSAITIPIVVIGGINKTTIPKFCGIGINGIAVVSAVISQPNILNATIELKNLFKQF